VNLFLTEKDYIGKARIDNVLRKGLPYQFLGYSVNFSAKDEDGVRWMERRSTGEVHHNIGLCTMQSFFESYLGIDPTKGIPLKAWLSFPDQKLLTIAKGSVFHDDLGIKKILRRFQYYPKDIWLYAMAAQWIKIHQEEPFVARASAIGDELGSRVIAARLVKELMELCFLMERKYSPYSKWLGTAFSELRISDELAPIFNRVLSSTCMKEREKWISKAYEIVARKHNSLRITDPLPTATSRFHNRPYLIIHGEVFSAQIRKQIRDRQIRELPLIGTVDQLLYSGDSLNPSQVRRLPLAAKQLR
jgi:hypothetical protein